MTAFEKYADMAERLQPGVSCRSLVATSEQPVVGGKQTFVAAPISVSCYALLMAVIRLVLISLAAALAGCSAGSILIFAELNRMSLVALPFTCMMSLLLLMPFYAAAREAGVAVGGRYARLLVAGGVAGALFAGFMFLATDPFKGAAIGSSYGALTAICWITIHAATKRLAALMA